ncbi:hypothetical protein B0H13DRAFT_2044150 [Mycena leptocephala]|nr:hypothetical protein B0H13DRAFT_2066476 [Mycena leptocephala]KAJ7886317.1 hypothetical protein B0H13DRAFT_2044150 [Mycena leptocephala]
MPISARTSAIIWAVAFVLDLATVGALTASLIIRKNHRDWYLIVMLILISIWAVAAAFTSWRWWRVHKAQTQVQASIPYYMSPPPVVSR